jgi:outer membrane lipoprotein-sorting protein
MASLGACSKASKRTSQVTTPTPTTTTTPTSSSDIFGPAQNIPAMKYTIVSGPAGGLPIVTVYLKKDNKMRMETDMGGSSTILLIDPTAKAMYTYLPAQNTAYITSDPINVMVYATMAGRYCTNPQATGTETIDGIACQIYEFNLSGNTAKIWVWKDKGLPIKIAMTDSTGTHTIEYKNYDFSDIPDSMFVLPAGVKMVQAPGS